MCYTIKVFVNCFIVTLISYVSVWQFFGYFLPVSGCIQLTATCICTPQVKRGDAVLLSIASPSRPRLLSDFQFFLQVDSAIHL